MYSALNFGDNKSLSYDLPTVEIIGENPKFSITPIIILAAILLILK